MHYNDLINSLTVCGWLLTRILFLIELAVHIDKRRVIKYMYLSRPQGLKFLKRTAKRMYGVYVRSENKNYPFSYI